MSVMCMCACRIYNNCNINDNNNIYNNYNYTYNYNVACYMYASQCSNISIYDLIVSNSQQTATNI